MAWHGELCTSRPGTTPVPGSWLSHLPGQHDDEPPLHVMLNMSDAGRDAALPLLGGSRWVRTVDTSLDPPHDILRPGQQVPVGGGRYAVQARSAVVLEAP